jgi:hypothetical protein
MTTMTLTRNSRLLSLTIAGSLTGALLFAGCGTEPDAAPQPSSPSAIEPLAMVPSSLEDGFARAAAESGVPATLLKAIAYAETRFYHVPGVESEFEGQAPAYGVMALRGERLARAAQLAGLPIDEVRSDASANVRAAAALLAAEARALGLPLRLQADIGAWAKVVAKFSGIADSDGQAHYVHRAVYSILREGIPGEELMRAGLRFEPIPEARPDYPAMPDEPMSLVGYSGAKWLPSPASNYSDGRSSTIQWLVIHTCAGVYSGCVSWLRTPYPSNPYKTSAHYVVNESGGEVAQLVDEADTAHHVGASWMGVSTNPRSIGIEHGGFPYDGSNRWTEGQIATSAKLSCDIVRRNGIIRDRNHIIGHYQPDPVNRANDPGRDFPWTDYMNRIHGCIGGGGGTEIVVDSNQANNDSSKAKVTPGTADWVSSTSVSGYWGTGYYVASSKAIADSVNFEFYLAADATREVFAWWTAATDRSTATPFVLFKADGTKLTSVTQNQQANGSRWNSLGRHGFTKGWNKVSVSRWTSSAAPGVVVADAIRVQ